ncbi:hypothetical protein KIPB_001219, partial [Kipferlia bialata]|eukprot:g1219.t1
MIGKTKKSGRSSSKKKNGRGQVLSTVHRGHTFERCTLTGPHCFRYGPSTMYND